MADEDHALIEVRTLGPFRVRRADGSWVDPGEWKTRKTIELLRILALQAGQKVSVDLLIDVLWGTSDPEHARTSLRTAASQIRKVLRQDCVARRHDGLVLEDVWVDAHRFKSLAAECRQVYADGRHVDAVLAAHQAEALYIHDVDGSDGDGPVGIEREALRRRRVDMLIDATSSAIALRWVRDATQFAERAIAIDPTSESACRAAMLAFHAAGEIEQALSIYQTCRARLVETMGVGPSAATQAVYLDLLRADSTREPEVAFVGLESETAELTNRLAQLSAGGGGFIVLAGPPRAGSSRWLAEAVSRLDASMPLGSNSKATTANGSGSDAGKAPIVSTVDGIEAWERGELEAAVLAQQNGTSLGHRGVVAAIHRTGVDRSADVDLDALVAKGLVHRVEVPSLSDEDAHDLTALMISGKPAPSLEAELSRLTGNRAGRMVDVITSWLAQGRLITTKQGVEVGADQTAENETGLRHQQLEQVHDAVSGEELTLLEIVAVANTPVSITAILAMLATDGLPVADADTRSHVERIVVTLEERGVLTVDANGKYGLPSRPLRDAISAWMRPYTRRRLNRLAAERLSLPFDARIDHWAAAGEPQLACAAAMEGALDAMSGGDFREARRRLHQVLELMDPQTAAPTDMVDILNRLAVCAGNMGDTHDSAEYRRQVVLHAETHGLAVPDMQILIRQEAHAAAARVRHSLLERLGISATSAPTAEVEALIRDAVVRAELRGDEDAAVEARLLLVGLILVPKRSFSAAYQVLEEVDQINARSHLPAARLARYEAAVLLGDPSVDLATLSDAWEESLRSIGATSGLSGAMLLALAHHERGDARSDELCDAAIADAESRSVPGPWRWVAARMLLRRGELERARALTRLEPWRVGGPTSQILGLLGKAELALAEHNKTAAASLLLRAAEIAQRTGATLLLPEVASRMVIDRDDDDRDSALDYLDLAEIAIGEATTGRERVILMLARAAVRDVVGRPLSAAAIAAGAATLATSLGLVHWAEEATNRRTGYLEKAGEELANMGAASGDGAFSVTDASESRLRDATSLHAVPLPADDSSDDV